MIVQRDVCRWRFCVAKTEKEEHPRSTCQTSCSACSRTTKEWSSNSQGSDATTISHQVSKLAHCSVPVTDTNLYPETYIRTDKVHCQRCGLRKKAAIMLLCDVCNEGWHFTCLEAPLDKVHDHGWRCEKHKVQLLPSHWAR